MSMHIIAYGHLQVISKFKAVEPKWFHGQILKKKKVVKMQEKKLFRLEDLWYWEDNYISHSEEYEEEE